MLELTTLEIPIAIIVLWVALRISFLERNVKSISDILQKHISGLNGNIKKEVEELQKDVQEELNLLNEVSPISLTKKQEGQSL